MATRAVECRPSSEAQPLAAPRLSPAAGHRVHEEWQADAHPDEIEWLPPAESLESPVGLAGSRQKGPGTELRFGCRSGAGSTTDSLGSKHEDGEETCKGHEGPVESRRQTGPATEPVDVHLGGILNHLAGASNQAKNGEQLEDPGLFRRLLRQLLEEHEGQTKELRGRLHRLEAELSSLRPPAVAIADASGDKAPGTSEAYASGANVVSPGVADMRKGASQLSALAGSPHKVVRLEGQERNIGSESQLTQTHAVANHHQISDVVMENALQQVHHKLTVVELGGTATAAQAGVAIVKDLYYGKTMHDLEKEIERAGCVKRLLQSSAFDITSAVAIILNAIMLGVETDLAAKNLPEDPENTVEYLFVVNLAFTSWFLVELILRMVAEGPVGFICGTCRIWNALDGLIVAVDVASTAMSLVASSTVKLGSLSTVRMFRVFRILRAVRVIRLFRFFKELRMMVFSMLRSGRLLFWAIVLIGIIVFVASVWMMQSATYHLYQNPVYTEIEEKLADKFGSLPLAAYYMFASISGGISWTELATPIMEVHWSHSLVMCFYIFCTVFAMLNIVTGIFVDTALSSAQQDHQDIIEDQMKTENSSLQQLKVLFQNADQDGSLTINESELTAQLLDQRVRTLLRVLGLELTEVRSIFEMLDIDKSGQLSIDEFVFGLMRMKGGARAVDLTTLVYEHRRLMENWCSFQVYVKEEFEQLRKAML